jgi:hypothetical protein
VAAAWIGCDPADPAPVSSGSAALVLPPIEATATLGAVVVPPFDPRPAVPLALAPMPPIPVEEEPPPPLPAATAPLRSTVMAASDATAAPSHPPLDLLLRPAREPGPAPRSVDLRTQPPAAAPAPAPPGAFERWKRQMRLERRSEPIGPAGARQGTHSEIEAALRVPLDEDVSLEGGVRVDQRDEPGAKKTPERQSTPRVGVEVRF